MLRTCSSDSRQAAATPAGHRALVLGTASSVVQLCHALQVVDPAPQVIGCLLPARADCRVDPALDRLPLPVLGTFDDLEDVVRSHQVEHVLVSLPMVWQGDLQSLTQRLSEQGVSWRIMPTLADQLAGRVTVPGRVTMGAAADLPLDLSQLVNRGAHALDREAIAAVLQGRVVLISGAGGSIGSELARLVVQFQPRRILLMERSENALFEIDRQLHRLAPQVERATLLHDVTDAARTLALVREHRPQVFFHAAAHKHVPMMEDHPAQAIENNFYGTRALADAADAVAAQRFVMISTDKAVNPSSVMGASKRLAELYVQWLGGRSATRFAMVRFGNVLGSACSVLPIWSQQLAAGEPITVTHPEMRRYFMTIPEAAGLVLQSAAMIESVQDKVDGTGTIFLLDMGEPIRILDLAHRFIRVHGLEPEVDVPIVFTGVRPGEKLHEELAYDSEDMIPTPHRAVRVWRTAAHDAARAPQLIERFDRLRRKSPGDRPDAHPWQHATRHTLLAALRSAVPEMRTHAAAG